MATHHDDDEDKFKPAAKPSSFATSIYTYIYTNILYRMKERL
jgi:hypothetical protein